MKCNIADILGEKKFVVTSSLVNIAVEKSLTLREFLLLLYFANEVEASFDVTKIASVLSLSEEGIMEAFNSLLMKNFISIENASDMEGRQKEIISLNNTYLMVEEDYQKHEQEKEKKNIYQRFEEELGRTLSPMEYEIMNAWQEAGNSEEIILGALKEAVYNGVNNFRYIDKIIYEWGKKGYKTMADVKSAMTKKEVEEKPVPLFGYNWLEDDDEGSN